jgi:hypothetical protein
VKEVNLEKETVVVGVGVGVATIHNDDSDWLGYDIVFVFHQDTWIHVHSISDSFVIKITFLATRDVHFNTTLSG